MALAQAGTHLADTATGVRDYLALLAGRITELLAQDAPMSYPVALTASVQVALNRLAAQSTAAVQLLTLAAYLAPEPIPLTLFSTRSGELPDPLGAVAGDPLAFTALIRLLHQHGLARVESATLGLHRLLAAILRAQPHQQLNLPTLAVRLLRAAVSEDPWDNPPAWPAWSQFLPHVLVATDPDRILTGVEEDVAWLLNHAAEYLHTQGESTPAKPLFERALDLRRSLLGEGHPDTLESAGSLSLNLWNLGQYERARELGEDTLTRCRRVLGDDHPHTQNSTLVIAISLWALGQHERARQLAGDTLTSCRRVLGDDHTLTLASASRLAATLSKLGQHEQARQLGEDTLTHCRRVLGDDHPDTLRSAHSLAAALANLGGHDKAQQREE
ncbi:MAG: tetratricopeptide repeat protein [Pseudonocardiaceae bacterium]